MSHNHPHSLLRRAHAELDAAFGEERPRDRFIHAHMAGLRAAAAVLAASGASLAPKRRRVRSAWVQLAELGEVWRPWAEYYTASAQTRAALESGQVRELESEQVSEAIVVSGQFLNVVEAHVNQHEDAFRALAQAS